MQNFTEYTETDPSAKVAITVTTLTATAVGGEDAYVVKPAPFAEFYDGWNHRFETSASAAAGLSRVLVWGVTKDLLTDIGGYCTSWTSGVLLVWEYDGANYKLRLLQVGGVSDASSNLSASVTYYVECRRYAATATVVIYSNAAYTTVVDTITIAMSDARDRYSEHYILATYGLGEFVQPTVKGVYAMECDSLTGWTLGGTGTAEILPAGQLHILPGVNAYRFASRATGSAAVSRNVIIEAKVYTDAIGTNASNNKIRITYATKDHTVEVFVCTDGLYIYNTSGGYTLATGWAGATAGHWYRVILAVDYATGVCRPYIKEDAGAWTALGTVVCHALDQPAGTMTMLCWRGASGASECHFDYMYAGEGDVVLGFFTNTMTVTVANLYAPTFHMLQPIHIGRALMPDYSHDGEVLPGTGWTETEGSGTTIELSSAEKYEGTNSIKITASGTSNVKLSRTITAPAYNCDASWYAKIASLSDGHLARLFYMRYSSGTPADERVAVAGVLRSGANYYWVIITKTGTAAYVLSGIYRHVVSLDTWYLASLVSVQPQNGLNLIVDGRCVVSALNPFSGVLQPNEIGMGSPGGEITYQNTSVVYLDALRVYTTKIILAAGASIMPDGSIIITATSNNQIANSVSEKLEIIRVNVSTRAMTHLHTIDYNAAGDGGTGIVVNGNDVYLFAFTELNATYHFGMYVYKSTDNLATYALVYTLENNNYLIMPSQIVEGGKILCCNWNWPWGGALSTSFVDYGRYNTADNTMEMTVSRLCSPNEHGTGFGPNEAKIWRNGAGNLTAIIRGDKDGETIQIQGIKISTDNGATWGALNMVTSLRSVGAITRPQLLSDGTMFASYYRSAYGVGYQDGQAPFIGRLNPATMEVLDERSIGIPDDDTWTGIGNGNLIASPDESFFYYQSTNSSAYTFIAQYGEASTWEPTPVGGFPVIHRRQRMRRAA